jgi:YVTN family beta-propeller protein
MNRRRRMHICAQALLWAGTLVVLTAGSASATFTTFESGQVRPLALSPDGTRLYAVNTPDDVLEIFAVDGSGNLAHTGSVPVGLEPVAVAARSNSEVWVVNHLSDSVSVVDVGTAPPRVTRTLLVGDEPRDIVFAGTGRNRAFITTAHRGQNRGSDPQLTTAGVGRADVWVFDATSLGASLGGNPLSILTLFCDTPRALAVSTDGNTVYAAAFHSGNQTTTVSEGVVCDGGSGAGPCTVSGTSYPGGLPPPNTNFQGVPQPEVGLIVRFNSVTGHFEDELGRNWTNAVRFNLPDRDVFAINANNLAAVPTPFAHVGTVLFNMAVNPASGKLYVSNTEAHNESRFEGPGTFAGHTVRGHLHEARISVISGSTGTPHHLNKHIEYDVVPSPAGVKADSLAIPTGMAVTSNGATLYVAAFGSSAVGIFDTAELESDTFTPSALDHIPVTGGGPSGLVLNETKHRLYVFTRFDDAVSVIDTTTASEIAHLPVHNPEPASVVNGRPVLYDAVLTSSNGEASCASCHVFGDFDSLAWDLGNPDDVPLNNPNPFEFGGSSSFNPLKGPMTTQSLRGMANHGPMHWRGDRTGGNDPGGDPLDESAAFKKFIIAFDGLLGRGAPITNAQMQAFTDFILQVTYPPNPVRSLDDSLNAAQQAGSDKYFGPVTDTVRNCDGCHVLDPASGFFGTDGEMSFENETQDFKIPHLRNLYQKVGMFGMPAIPPLQSGSSAHQGDQVRGFGFLHDGSIDTLFRFHGSGVFSLTDTEQQQLEQFMLAFDSNLAPIVGQQITLTSASPASVGTRISLLIARAAANECELTVKGNRPNPSLVVEQRGWLRLANGTFTSDRASEAALTDAQLRAQAATAGQERTYLCVPPGSGTRVGIDRDEDGFRDRDELDAGSDPADPLSTPGATTTTTTSPSTTSTTLSGLTLIPSRRLVLKDRTVPVADASRRRFSFRASTASAAPANQIVPPTNGSADDPVTAGGVLYVYDSSGLTTDLFSTTLAGGWSSTAPGRYQYRNSAVGAPITRVVLRANQLTVKGGRENFTYSLDEPAQGRVAMRLVIGSRTWCAETPAKQSGNPPSTANNDHVDKFVGQPKALPAACPPNP